MINNFGGAIYGNDRDIVQQISRMLYLMDGLYLQSPLRTISVLVLHLLTHFCRGQSQLIVPLQPIVARVGDDIILPCHLEPVMDIVTMTFDWTRSDLNTFAFVWRSGQEFEKQKSESYKGRTSLFTEELKNGNISLKLSKVELSDKGNYSCYIRELEKRSFVELVVVALDAASSPVISLAGVDRDRGAVVLQCESKGWYPEPEVFWLDGEGNLLSAGPTETVRGSDNLHTVSSRVTVEKRHGNSFTCRVQQNNINQAGETHIIVVPDDFFKVPSSSSPVTVGLAVCIVLIGAVAVFFGWKWRQEKINTTGSPQSGDTEMQPLNPDTIKDKQDEVQKLQDEKQNLQEDLNTKTSELEEKQAELLKEKQIRESEVKKLNKQLESKQTEIQDLTKKLEESERKLKAQYEKEIKDKQDEVQKLQVENQNIQEDLKTKTSELEEKQDELPKEKQDREKAEEEVKKLKNQLESKQTEIPNSDCQDFTSNSNVTVEEVDQKGKFVRLKNKSNKNQPLGNWKLEIDNKTSNISYTFSTALVLDAGKILTIWASDGGGSHNPPTDVVWKELKSWGSGDILKVTLKSPMGEVMGMKTVPPP